MEYPLKALLELRRREEEAALGRLADAARARDQAEAEAARRAGAASNARGRHEDASARTTSRHSRTTSAAALIEATRFLARLRDEWARAEDASAAFRSGPLKAARSAEATARAAHLDARHARAALDEHASRFRERERRTDARRDEEASDDAARAADHARRERRAP